MFVPFSFLNFLDGPADCSTTSVILQCQLITNAHDDTTGDFLIMTLQIINSLMCVNRYEIQFNGQSEIVSLESPAAIFVISDGEQPVLNQITVNTIDYENRIGQVPCNFSIPGEFPRIFHVSCPNI